MSVRTEFFLFLIVVLFSSCNWVPEKLQDNPIEEEIEEYIEQYTGIDADLSGKTEEK